MLRPYNLMEVPMIPDSSHHGRRSVRLPGYDYAQPGAYFITMCTAGKQCLFGSVKDGRVDMSDCGAIIEECWLAVPRHFPLVQLDARIIMPNHAHSVILISHKHVDPFAPTRAAIAHAAHRPILSARSYRISSP